MWKNTTGGFAQASRRKLPPTRRTSNRPARRRPRPRNSVKRLAATSWPRWRTPRWVGGTSPLGWVGWLVSRVPMGMMNWMNWLLPVGGDKGMVKGSNEICGKLHESGSWIMVRTTLNPLMQWAVLWRSWRRRSHWADAAKYFNDIPYSMINHGSWSTQIKYLNC